MAFTHNSKLADNEPDWGQVDKTRLPRAAFADQGEEATKSTWAFPHHWVSDGSDLSEAGVYTTGTMFLHRGGLAAARSAAGGGRSGEEASAEVKSHLDAHAADIGMGEGSAANSQLLNQEIPADVPEWVMVLRTGAWLGHPVRPEIITPAHLQSALDSFTRNYAANGADLPIDYHHHTLLAATGQVDKAPAAGWIKQMQLRNGGTELWGHVLPWVVTARNAIAAREFRYLSPVLHFNAPDRVTAQPVLMQIQSVALTNTPFLTELPALNESSATDGGRRTGRETDHSNVGEGHMRLFELLAQALGKGPDQVAEPLGLDKGADDKAVAEKVMANAVRLKDLEAKPAQPAPVLNDAVASFLGVAPGSDEKAVKAAIGKLMLNADGIAVRRALGLAPEAKVEEVVNVIGTLRATRRTNEAEELVNDAVSKGRVPPAQRDTLMVLAQKDIEAARALVNGLPVMTNQTSAKAPEAGAQLTASEQLVANQLGLTAEQMKAARN